MNAPSTHDPRAVERHELVQTYELPRPEVHGAGVGKVRPHGGGTVPDLGKEQGGKSSCKKFIKSSGIVSCTRWESPATRFQNWGMTMVGKIRFLSVNAQGV